MSKRVQVEHMKKAKKRTGLVKTAPTFSPGPAQASSRAQ
jgi:hypothetical protein